MAELNVRAADVRGALLDAGATPPTRRARSAGEPARGYAAAASDAAAARALRGLDTRADAGGRGLCGSALYGDEAASCREAAVRASLGCGNPTAVAELHPGEIVLDLGSGGGIDVLLSARRVGPTGRPIGLDMTDEMLDARPRATRARRASRTSSSSRATSRRSRSPTPASTSSSPTA